VAQIAEPTKKTSAPPLTPEEEAYFASLAAEQQAPVAEPAAPPIVEQGSSAPAVTGPPPTPAPASEYYGGETSAQPFEDVPPADRYAYDNANNPNYVQTTYPSTGAPTTTRYIPPAGSTFPSVERDRALPPPPTFRDFQEAYPRAYPDIEPYYAGEGGRDASPPPPYRRYVPADVHNNIFHQYHAGEGAMGRSDVLDPRNATPDGRPIVNYKPGIGTPSGFTRFRPGWGGRAFLETAATHGGPPAPPPGYVPELIRHQGRTVSTRDMERARPRTLSPTPMPPPPNQPPPPPRGGYPYNDDYAPGSINDLMTTLERGRRARTLEWLDGLFGGGEG
jgi:hypothetical protein